MRQTTISERELVIHHLKQGKSYAEIAEIVNRSRSTVQYIIKRYKDGNQVSNKVKRRSDKKLTASDERWILRKIKEDPTISAPKIAADIEKYLGKKVSDSTVRRVLRKNNYHGRIARNKPFINDRNKKKRLDFAREHLKKPADYWKDVIFTDESKFNVFSSDGKNFCLEKA